MKKNENYWPVDYHDAQTVARIIKYYCAIKHRVVIGTKV